MKATTIKLLTLSVLAGSSLSLSAQNTDSPPLLKHAIGISLQPVTLYYWTHPGITVDNEWSEEPQRKQLNYYYPVGISYQYRLSGTFTLVGGLQYSKESRSFDADVQTDYGVSGLSIDYNVSYYKIPLGIRFYPDHRGIRKNHSGGFFMQLTYNVDLLAKENITTTTAGMGDPHYAGTPGYQSHSPAPIVEETNNNNIRYHRITPSYMMGGSIGEKHFSFFFATQLQFFGVFQPHITQEYFKNAQLGMVLGTNYRF